VIIDAGDVPLYVEEHGTGTPVILLHGFPDSGRLWRHQVPVLVEHGFRVIVPDLRGFGRSGRPEDVASYRLPVMSLPFSTRSASRRRTWSGMTGAPPWPG
jgi:pimeloyl-ACP methyl ester carboxylesterase